jgi:hypothetical protein
MIAPSTTGLAALAVAKQEIGASEEGGQNQGADVIRFRRGDGTGRPADTREPWCASFASFCLRIGGYLGRTSRSALRLADELEKEGGIVVPYPVPGAIIVWRHRKWFLRLFRRRGHVGICEEYDHEKLLPEQRLLTYVDGNAGPSPQTVARRYRGDWEKLLYKIVVPPDAAR